MRRGILWLTFVIIMSSLLAGVSASPAGAAEPAKFKVRNLLIEPKEAQVGEPVKIRAEVVNEGEESGSYTATFKLNGVSEYTRTVTIMGQKGGGMATLVIYITTRDSPGTYQVEVEGLTGSFKVVGSAVAPIWQNVWLWAGIALGILVILFLVWLMRRRVPAPA
ncbi:MAG: CARDB domain-containing protein [Chloroflexota bacterium]